MTIAIAIALLAVISFALRSAGLLIDADNPHVERVATPLTAAILASLVVTTAFAAGTELVVDARIVGLLVAMVAAIRRAPLTLILLLAITATALTRLVS